MKSNFCLYIVAACLALPSAALAQLSFNTTAYPVSGQGLGVTTGDFNTDGLPDLAVGEGSSVAVFLATGPGTYGPRADYDTGAAANFVSTADVNGDGALDVIVGHASASYLTILLNNGDGAFSTGTSVSLNGSASGFALADFNHDGFVDLVITECPTPTSGCTLTVLLNNGDGTFRPTINLASTDTRLVRPVAIDFNRDGNADIATASTMPARVLVYFGNGDGTFSGPTALTINNPIPPQSAEALGGLAVGDFDGDTTPDLAVVAGYICGSACGQDTAHIFLSNADRTFTEISTVTVWTNGGGGQLLSSDLNGDMVQDLVYWNSAHFGGGNSFWLGNGDGTFTSTDSNFNGGEISQFVARDLDLDSRHDLAVTTWLGSAVAVALNTSAAPNCPPVGGNPAAPAAIVCTPHDGDTVPADTQIAVQAGGSSPAGIARMELWVDGVKQCQIWNDQLACNVSLPAGTHQIAVVAVDQYVGYSPTTITVTAQ